MIFSSLKKSILALGLLIPIDAASAGQVLTKIIPEPAGTAGMGEWYGQAPVGSSASGLAGFRTCSDGTHSYQSGNLTFPVTDGWISKVDSIGGTVWSKSMNQIVNASPNAGSIHFGETTRGFTVNDIIFADGYIYICGESRPGGNDGWGYVARLDSAGTLLDWSMFEPGKTDNSAKSSRAVALCAYFRPDGVRIGVAGDFEGTSLKVLPRLGTGQASMFDGMVGRMDNGSRRDVFGVTFEGNLGVARRGWTLGFNTANEFASAAAFDNGDLIVAMTFDDPDAANANLEFHNMDDERRMFRALNNSGGYDSVPFDESNFPNNYNFASGKWSSIIKVSGDTNRIASHAEPTQLESGEAGSFTQVTDLLEDGGSLYCAGNWRGTFRPTSTVGAFGYWNSNANSKDMFVARLGTADLGWQKLIFLDSPLDDEINQLVVTLDGIYVTGSAGNTLTHHTPNGNYAKTADTLTGASQKHLFWTKLRKNDLGKVWHITPYQSVVRGIGIGQAQSNSGISFAGENMLLTAANAIYPAGGTSPIRHTFGSENNFKTTPLNSPAAQPDTGGGVFNVVAKPDGIYLEEVRLTINSAFGNPLPFRGNQSLPSGQTVRISVEPIVYEDSAGSILDSRNPTILKTSAVTRRICTGYTVGNSTINGTASTLDYNLTGNSEINFLWRTEHALEVKTNLPAGLTSEASGAPAPEVNKHWLAEGDPVIAQINGSTTTLDQTGVRYRSTGYTATGPAVPAGGTAGGLVTWASFQDRQQVPQFILTAPVTIIWQWQKEVSLRVSTIPAAAAGAATATAGPVTATGDGEFWFAPASSVTLTSPGLRDAGRLTLQSYINGSGSVIPSSQPAGSSALSKTISLDTASSITWNYGKTPLPLRVTIGDALTGLPAAITDTRPLAVIVVSDAPAGTNSANSFAWEPLGKRLLPLRPGKYLLEYNDPALDAANANTEDNLVVEVTAGYQGEAIPGSQPAANFPAAADSSSYQTFIAGSPAVKLDTSTTDRITWRSYYTLNETTLDGLALAGGNAGINGDGAFSATEAGTSVLLFTQAPVGTIGRGSLATDTVFLRIVRVKPWSDPSVLTADSAIVGSPVTAPASHDEAVIGHGGYVLTPRARYNVFLHDNSTLLGPIFPVNTQFTGDADDKLVVAWFNRDTKISANWPSTARDYTVTWPAVTPRIVIAGRLGIEGLAGTAAGGQIQPILSTPRYTNVFIYTQNNPALPGYNPNEEHALVAPSFLDASRNSIFALQNTLNRTTEDATFTSPPYVLVDYSETLASVTTRKMAVYAVEWQDAAVVDSRLPAYNQAYTPKYQTEAGKILTPPWPVANLYGAKPWPVENEITNQDPAQRSAWQDRKKQWWAASGDTDADTEVDAVFHYPLADGFWHPTKVAGDAVPLHGSDHVFFNTIWPANTPVLKGGETLTHSGGEAFSDGISTNGLPSVVGMASAEIIYDQANRSLASSAMPDFWVARVANPITAIEVDLPLATLPETLRPTGGKLIVDGLFWRFKDVNAGLQKRLFYDSQRGKLGFRGFLNGRTTGDRELTAAPPAINLLQPNIMTEAEKVQVLAVSTEASWITAVNALYLLSRDPVENTGSRFTVGLSGTSPAFELKSQTGPGLALISNPALADPALLTSVGADGYVTIAENNLDSLGESPVALHVIRVDRTTKFRGAISPIYPENVFDEKITLRHSGDFGGNVGDLVFQWYYREEDGSVANPPGVAQPSPPGAPAAGRWTLFGEVQGVNEISLSGASAALLADNLFFARWRHKNEPSAEISWSQWAGAANSHPPITSSPSVNTDTAYVPQLAEGWVKRVTNSVNPFDARIRDFRNNDSPSTAVSIVQQAGGRWEGNVAFNPSKDVIENYGLIEIYQTVLNRAADLSINLQPGTSGVNTALLNAANRIASLYTMLGNEASTDALDPTIGFGTQSGQYGNLAPSIYCFQNQAGSLLDEELALLRGRGEIGARPAYNRLIWNFTNGPGQAAYAMNYGITDVNNDGFINANDAARLYPQGHGDAWGQYTMALRGYATLFRNASYAWDARSEKYQINGTVFDVDYLDERTFAQTAAARAKAGTQIVDLVYRQKYTDNPAGQWQGYQDTNTDRGWGLYEWAQRAGTGALFDWATANALLPAKDESKDGVQRVDRTTVPALGEVAANASAIQSHLDQADNALNPLGLDADAVPFDIDPARTDRTGVSPATHFEQIYERALGASKNAVLAFDHANQAGQLLRRTANSAEDLRKQTIDQDRDYRNRLIEIFGTPYQGQIGTGKAYPAGYTGPDLYLFMYSDTVEVSKATVPATPKDMTVKLSGLLTLATDSNPFREGNQALPDYAKSYVTNWFPADYPAGVTEFGSSPFYEFTVPLKTSGYAFQAPAGWGVRSSPGKVQAALAGLLQAEYDMLMATEGYEGFIDDYNRKIRVFTAKTGLAAADIKVTNEKLGTVRRLTETSATLNQIASALGHVREGLTDLADATKDGLPTGFSDFAAPIRLAIGFGYYGGATILRATQAVLENRVIANDRDSAVAEIELTLAQTNIAYQGEVIDMLEDLESHINSEPDMRLGIFQATEKLRSAGDRYRAELQEGLRLVEEREAFNKRVAATTTLQRYEDFTFRIARNQALGKFHSTFDLAARYAWLAGKAYSYELNLPDNHAANAAPVIAEMLRTRTLGHFENGVPTGGDGGLAEQLATLKGNFDVFKGQLGFNSPSTQTVSFSLRTELARVGLSSRTNTDWRNNLETYRVADLWNYSYSRDGVDYGKIFRRYCRPFAPESAGPQAALVIPFSSTITAGQNWFGKTLTGGDSAFTASNFATKIRASGVKFDSYNSTALSVTPQVYLVPVGLDRMYLPESNTLESRSWRVLDQRIPVPLAITSSQLTDPGWLPFTGSSSGYFEEARRYPAFRAYHDAGGYTNAEMLQSSRLVGRSVWNTQWVLIIPSSALLADPAAGSYPGDADAGLDTFIYGAPLPSFTHAAAGTTNRDGNGVRDIHLLLQTYSVSGN